MTSEGSPLEAKDPLLHAPEEHSTGVKLLDASVSCLAWSLSFGLEKSETVILVHSKDLLGRKHLAAKFPF